jgi:hypothetical protein
MARAMGIDEEQNRVRPSTCAAGRVRMWLLAACPAELPSPLAARYCMWEASTDMISPARSWPMPCPEESPMCRVASGSSRARPRA